MFFHFHFYFFSQLTRRTRLTRFVFLIFKERFQKSNTTLQGFRAYDLQDKIDILDIYTEKLMITVVTFIVLKITHTFA